VSSILPFDQSVKPVGMLCAAMINIVRKARLVIVRVKKA